jgi:hypothetical protein
VAVAFDVSVVQGRRDSMHHHLAGQVDVP